MTAVATRLFLSWAHADTSLKEDLLSRLDPNLRILSGIETWWWEDTQLATGEGWRGGISTRIGECEYGVLLLSPAFFASKFITSEELPHFVGPAASKGALPVMLSEVTLDGSRDLHGVETAQIFTDRGKAYSDLDRRGRDRFARDLATAIAYRLRGRGWRRV